MTNAQLSLFIWRQRGMAPKIFWGMGPQQLIDIFKIRSKYGRDFGFKCSF